MDGGEKRVLYVESDHQRNRLLSGIFSELNYQIFSASSSDEALKSWDTTRPDLVILNADGEGDGVKAVSTLQKKNGNTPFVILSSDPAFGGGVTLPGVSRVVHIPAPEEDVVDCVERAIGLPSPPEEEFVPIPSAATSEIDEIEYQRMETELDSLHEQLHFYQKQLDQVSVAGEREGREIDQVLKDFQDEINSLRKERDGFKDEIDALKRELKDKGQELINIENKVKQEKKLRISEIETQKKETAKLRQDIEKEGDKHKRAQSALREFYKKKLVKSDQIKKDLKALEDQLDKERKASKDYAAQLKKAQADAGDVKELKGKVEKLQTERDDLAREKDSIMRDLVHAKEQAEETQKKLDQIKSALG